MTKKNVHFVDVSDLSQKKVHVSHSSSHKMRPLVGCTFKAFLRLLDMEFHSFDHGHLI